MYSGCYAFSNVDVHECGDQLIHLSHYAPKPLMKTENPSVTFVEKENIKTPHLHNHNLLAVHYSRIDNKEDIVSNKGDVKKTDTCFTDNNNHNDNDDNFFKHAYTLYKEDLPKKLKGNFSYIIWDNAQQELHAAIDAFSARSLFYMQLGDAFFIASDARVLANHPNISLTVNKKAVAQWLSGRPDPNISMYNEIQKLPSGHQLLWRNNTLRITKFWDIDKDKKITYKNDEAYQEHFYDVLYQSVSSRLSSNINDSQHPIFSQMSGGMDSTSVTALANIEASKSKSKKLLHTLSHSYKNTESCNEIDNINDMINTLKLSNTHFIELDKYDSTPFTALYPTDFDSPGIVLSQKYHEELALIQKQGAKILLTGNGGDEMCWGHSASYRSRLYKGDLSVVTEVINACKALNEPVAGSLINLFVKPLVPNSVKNLVRFALNKPQISNQDNPAAPWLTETSKALVEETITTNPYSYTFEPAKYARYESLLNTSTYNGMRSYQKVADNYGVDVRHPFFDTDVVEFSFAIPEKMLIRGSYPKWLLRKTMEPYLPESVVWNKHKTVFDHHFANLVRSNKDELRELLSHSGLHDLGLLNNDVLLEAFDDVVNNPNQHLHVDLLYAILTQCWYQTHCLHA